MNKALFSLMAMLLLLTACRPTATTESEGIVGPSQLNVELLKDSLDLQMDITHLSVSDLHILSNAPAARRGFPFKDSYVRAVYETTTWYDSLMWNFDEHMVDYEAMDAHYDTAQTWRGNYYRFLKDSAVNYPPEEEAFVRRVKAREAELLQQNFKVAEGERVNIGNLVNPGLLKNFDPKLQHQLARNGFAIVPGKHQQLFHIYEQNDYHQFPSFVTTDLFLQLYHLYFDAMLRETEQQRFFGLLGQFCQEARKQVSTVNDGSVEQWIATYFTVANALLTEKAPVTDEVAQHEYEQVMKSENNFSDFLGYQDVMFEYSLFRPRGHYTRTDTLQRYFRAMMWLQTVPFRTDRESDMKKAFALAELIGSNPQLTKIYQALTEPMTWLIGQPDDVGILQVWELLKNEDDQGKVVRKIDEMAEKQTRIRPKFLRSGRNKVRLMPQRYMPDAEVLQEMVDYKSKETKRGVPRGLDVFAAIGNTAAERILLDEMGENGRWEGFKPTLSRMKQRMDSIDWSASMATTWVKALKTQSDRVDKAPYFMLTDQWDKKTLNTALASWAELKHDAILYAKQPMGAECGGAGPPAPVVKGYVEPNVKFWQQAVALLEQTGSIFNRYGLSTERSKAINLHLLEHAKFLLRISEKELAGQMPTDEECDQLKIVGSIVENLSLELIRNPEQNLYEWADVQGPERNVALIADVYTANADNNPAKSVLYEGVGMGDEIYVVIEIEGYLHLMRGAVFSYRELERPYGEQRMNDEEWQKKLETEPRLGVPVWMNEITVPVEEAPVDNDEVFYSSGC